MINYLKKIIKHDLVKKGSIFFLGSNIANFLSFIFNLILVRQLTISNYGIYSSLISFVSLFAMPSSAISTVIIRFSTEFFAQKNIKAVAKMYKKFLRFVLIFSLILFSFLSIFSLYISKFLKIDDMLIIILAIGVISFSYIYTVYGAFLQGFLKFEFLSIVSVLSTIFKIVLVLLFLYLGFSLRGVFGAILLATIFPIILVNFNLSFLSDKKNNSSENHFSYQKMLNYALPSGLALFFVSSFITSDILLVKHFLTPFEAGKYASIALMGRVIFYFSSPFIAVSLPYFIKKNAINEKSKNNLILPIVIIALASLSFSLFYLIFPGFLSRILLGKDIGHLYYLSVFLYGVFMSIYSVLMLLVNFFLSKHGSIIYKPIIFFAFVQVAGIILLHKNFEEIIMVSMLSAAMLLISLLVLIRNENIVNKDS